MIHFIHLIFQRFRVKVLAIPGRVIALLFIIALFTLPLITSHPYVLRVLSLAAIFSIYAVSWDLLSGFTGQLNLGHALFFGVAAYTAALLNIHLELSPWATVPLGALAAVLIGLIAGIPARRLRGFYLALVTLSFPIILTGIIYVFSDYTGGEMGIYGVASLSDSTTLDYYIIVIIMLISVFLMYKFTDAKSTSVRIGIILHAIREDEITARTSGINTPAYKLLAFATSGFFAGIAGGLYAHFLKIAGPSTLELFFSFQAVLWTIFGGITTIYGAVAGVYILFPFIEFLRISELGGEIRFLIFAIILMLVMLFMPEGLTPWILDKIEIKCQRCKLTNVIIRRTCRACRAPLHLDQKHES